MFVFSPKNPEWPSRWEKFFSELDFHLCDDGRSETKDRVAWVKFTELGTSLDEVERFMRRRLSMEAIHEHEGSCDRVIFHPASPDAMPRMIVVVCPGDHLIELGAI